MKSMQWLELKLEYSVLSCVRPGEDEYLRLQLQCVQCDEARKNHSPSKRPLKANIDVSCRDIFFLVLTSAATPDAAPLHTELTSSSTLDSRLHLIP